MLRNSIAVDLVKGKGEKRREEKRRGGEGAEEEMRRYEGRVRKRR